MRRNCYEVLAPVGRIEDMEDIIGAGADAIYVGLAGFSSRPRSSDLNIDEIWRGVELAHLKKAAAYVAINACINETRWMNWSCGCRI